MNINEFIHSTRSTPLEATMDKLGLRFLLDITSTWVRTPSGHLIAMLVLQQEALDQ